jgi:hypothetical protein
MIAAFRAPIEARGEAMDESARNLERRIAVDGDPLARVRLAHEKLRARDAKAALAALGETPDTADRETRALDATIRARATHELGRLDDALAFLGSLAPEVLVSIEWRPISGVIGAALVDRTVPLARPRAARVVARLKPGDGELDALARELARDSDPLVRLALVQERPPFDPVRDGSRRVYGSHGADYEMGIFVAFEMSTELCLRFFEPGLCAAVNAALATLAPDATFVESLGLRTAFGEGYGLGGVHQARDGGLALESALARLNALDVLPWRMHTSGVRPYDLVEDRRKLASRIEQSNLRGHPARQRQVEQAQTPVERILSHHPLGGLPARREVVTPLLEEARAQVTDVGYEALELFVKRARAGGIS